MLEFHGIPCFTYINIGIPRFAYVRKSWNSMEFHDLPLPLLALHLIIYTLTNSQRIFASLQYAGATARCKHCRHIESANRKWSYNIHGRPIVFNLTREYE